jgi:hypothetical protein
VRCDLSEMLWLHMKQAACATSGGDGQTLLFMSGWHSTASPHVSSDHTTIQGLLSHSQAGVAAQHGRRRQAAAGHHLQGVLQL